MKNPFKYGCIVTGQDFCDRPKLISQLSEHIETGQNIVVYGERRTGKSSAVYKAVIETKPRKPLQIDFMGVKSIDDLIKRILKAVVAQENKRGYLPTIMKRFAAIRPTISLDPITTIPTFSFDASVKINAESIGEAINLIQDLYGDNKVAVIMDEFQDILDLPEPYEAVAILRANIQYQANIPYIFVGSIRKKMDSIFTDSHSPFFKAAIPIEVNAIDNERFAAFIIKKMKKGKRIIDQEYLDAVFELTNTITGDVQQLCQALWSVSKEKDRIDTATIKAALELIFSRERYAYENYVRLLTNFQQKTLIAIARQGGKSILSNDFMRTAGFTNPSTVKRCVQRLIALNILFEHKSEYRFVNPFFRSWLLSNQ